MTVSNEAGSVTSNAAKLTITTSTTPPPAAAAAVAGVAAGAPSLVVLAGALAIARRIAVAPDLQSSHALIGCAAMNAPPRAKPDRQRHRATSGKVLGWVLLGLLGLALAGTMLLQAEKQPEASPVGRGEKLAQQAGCFACHGRGDGEPRFNLRQANDKWAGKANPTFWENGIPRNPR